ncbi:serine hydrolase [Pontibacter sp. G13]|uniref:serine hydrolase n=1 Tax=Pontibacter sp. G13 TaxID=3074898 RepID=UPI00288C5628|nr:serine hydrolase [Pontibacter sp. G13]WNJ19939.1 serine hydrolase [Pontibacter sp. G13]
MPPLPLQDSLLGIFQQHLTASGAAGGIMMIESPDQWRWQGASGHAFAGSGIVADEDMIFRIGSLSKSIIAASLVKLQSQGTLDLDDTLGVWLDPALVQTIAYGDQITIRQLLAHTSGIPDYVGSSLFFNDFFNNGPSYVYTPEELVGYGVDLGAAFAPGMGFLYSNTNFVLAAMIIESASMMSYETYVLNQILMPMGMTQTYFPVANILSGAQMGTYSDIDNNGTIDLVTQVPPSVLFGSGPLVSKLPDMMKWVRAIQTESFLSAAEWTEMKSLGPTGTPGFEYGLGLQAYAFGPFTGFGHSGEVFNSSNMQTIGANGWRIVYNTTHEGFPHDQMMQDLTQFMQLVQDSCQLFQPNLNVAGQVAYQGVAPLNLQASVGGDYQYQWQWDETPVGANTASFAATQPGTYRSIVQDGWGCRDTLPEVEWVDCVSPKWVNPAADTLRGCEDAPIPLTSSWKGDSVQWKAIGVNSSFLVQQSFSWAPTDTGNLIVAEIHNVCGQAFDTVFVQSYPKANSGLDPVLAISLGSDTLLSVGSPGDSVNWYTETGTLLEANTSSFLLEVNGDTAITVEMIPTGMTCPNEETIQVMAFAGMIAPVEWADFQGNWQDGRVLLEWGTWRETNNAYFDVERLEAQGIIRSIGRVEAVGESRDLQVYQWEDALPDPQARWYRITQTDLDGTQSRTDWMEVNVPTKAATLQAWPNPATNLLNVETPYEEGTLMLIDVRGAIVQQIDWPGRPNESIQWSLDGISAGMYLLQFVSHRNVEALPIQVQ